MIEDREMQKKCGVFVEGRYFGFKLAQAEGFARFRANQYGRRVKVEYVGPRRQGVVATFKPEASNA
jgi:hypothetical protein